MDHGHGGHEGKGLPGAPQELIDAARDRAGLTHDSLSLFPPAKDSDLIRTDDAGVRTACGNGMGLGPRQAGHQGEGCLAETG